MTPRERAKLRELSRQVAERYPKILAHLAEAEAKDTATHADEMESAFPGYKARREALKTKP